MKKRLFLVALAVILTVAPAAFAVDVMLPNPQKNGGPAVLEAIATRSSAKQEAFENTSIPEQDLSTLLWAGTGLNRDKGWTVPMAMGAAPYVDIYVLLKSGVYSYDWKKNRLLQLSTKNIIPRASGQDYVATAPCILIFATKGGRARVESWADVAAGSMSQNVYLACEALGLKARYAATFNKETLLNNMELAGVLLRIIAIMPVGYQN